MSQSDDTSDMSSDTGTQESFEQVQGDVSGGVYSVDDEDQPGAEDFMSDRGIEDPLDEGYSPPEKPLGVNRFGTTLAEERAGETLDMRLQQEVPDPALAFDDPLAEPADADDDPDSIAAEDDWIGDGEVGDVRAGRLVDPDEGVREDVDKDLVGDDVGIDGGAASAEEAAMHVIDNP